jgi:hypothetical protein
VVAGHLAVEATLLRRHGAVVADVRGGVLLLRRRRADRGGDARRRQAHAGGREGGREHAGAGLEVGGRQLPVEVARSLKFLKNNLRMF